MTTLLTSRVVAERLDVAPATVLRWTRNGDIPAVRLPSGELRYPEDQFEAWLAERATPGTRSLSTTTPSAANGRLVSLSSTTTDDEE